MDWVALGTPRLLRFLNRGAFVLGIGVMAIDRPPPRKLVQFNGENSVGHLLLKGE